MLFYPNSFIRIRHPFKYIGYRRRDRGVLVTGCWFLGIGY
jgi:hypothetical protein